MISYFTSYTKTNLKCIKQIQELSIKRLEKTQGKIFMSLNLAKNRSCNSFAFYNLFLLEWECLLYAYPTIVSGKYITCCLVSQFHDWWRIQDESYFKSHPHLIYMVLWYLDEILDFRDAAGMAQDLGSGWDGVHIFCLQEKNMNFEKLEDRILWVEFVLPQNSRIWLFWEVESLKG